MKRHLTPANIVLSVVVVIFISLLLRFQLLRSSNDATPQPDVVDTTPNTNLSNNPAPALPTSTLVSINNVDPSNGKRIGPDSPTILYKGNIIGFCCKSSPAANGGWQRMSEAEKDAFVARFVK